jgi:hypothetical protein
MEILQQSKQRPRDRVSQKDCLLTDHSNFSSFYGRPKPRRSFSNIVGAPVLDLPPRGVRSFGEALVNSIGRSMIFFFSAIIRVRRDGMPWRGHRPRPLGTGLLDAGRQ